MNETVDYRPDVAEMLNQTLRNQETMLCAMSRFIIQNRYDEDDYRWHYINQHLAPHLKQHLKSGEKRVWIECEIDDFKTYPRPPSQGGEWILAQNLTAIRTISDDEVERLSEERSVV